MWARTLPLVVSVFLHAMVYMAAIAVNSLPIRVPPARSQANTPNWVNLVELPVRPRPQDENATAPTGPRDSPITYAMAQKRPSGHPSPTPRPRIARTPRPKVQPREISEYRRLNPALRKVDDTRARMMVQRLKDLGLSAASASSITKAVDLAIAEGSRRLYHPTTPDSTESLPMRSSTAVPTDSPPFSLSFAPPTTWVATPSPIASFLARMLPTGRPYEAELTQDPETGQPELRMAISRTVNYLTFEDRTFIARWNPTAVATPVVEVTVLRSDGKPERNFMMPLPPFGTSLEAFKEDMFGLTLLAYQEALAGRTLASP